MDQPYVVLSHEIVPNLAGLFGTSFAAPSIVRIASGVRVHFGPINPQISNTSGKQVSALGYLIQYKN